MEEFPEFSFRYLNKIEKWRALKVKKQTRIPKVTTFHGKDTGTGKSHAALEAAGSDVYETIVIEKGGKFWLEGYYGETNVIIEDFEGEIPYRMLLRMLDKYPIRMENKGGSVQWSPTHIWITSNLHPRDWYPDRIYHRSPLWRRIELQGTLIHKTVVYVEDSDSD